METSIFEVLGPVMIGPSSSHTAGAARLARIAAQIVGVPFHKVNFYLHGSFAETYGGHGTDRALVAGVLGFREDDERLRSSMQIAAQRGLEFSFIKKELRDCHENTVLMEFFPDTAEPSSGKPEPRLVLGSSIGGGRILITKIDGYDVRIDAVNPTIIIQHEDRKGVMSELTTCLAQAGINIALMTLSRRTKGETASTILETDDRIPPEIQATLERVPHVKKVIVLNFDSRTEE